MYQLSVELYLVDGDKQKDLAAMKKRIVDELGKKLHSIGYPEPTPMKPTVQVKLADVNTNRSFAVLNELSVVAKDDLDAIFAILESCFTGILSSAVEIQYVGRVLRPA